MRLTHVRVANELQELLAFRLSGNSVAAGGSPSVWLLSAQRTSIRPLAGLVRRLLAGSRSRLCIDRVFQSPAAPRLARMAAATRPSDSLEVPCRDALSVVDASLRSV